MKDIKDYLPLYLGCKMMIEILDSEGVYFDRPQIALLTCHALCEINRKVWRNPIPILRPLSDMTEEDYAFINHGYNESNKHSRYGSYYWEAEQTRYLLSKQFDLFGLIESGLAIDTTTLKPKDKL